MTEIHDEVGYARAMREIRDHGESLMRFTDELLSRVHHPSLAQSPQVLFLRAIADDIQHQAGRLVQAAEDLTSAVDRRRKR
jgi:hypothetical protein